MLLATSWRSPTASRCLDAWGPPSCTARIGVAVADLFPRVTFTGSAGYVATTSDGLGDSGSGAHVIAPGISWAIFDLGHVQARIEASRARQQGALLRYEQAVLQALEVSESTYLRCRNQYGGMKAEEAKRLKLLEEENKRLKELVANQALDIQMLKYVAEKNW